MNEHEYGKFWKRIPACPIPKKLRKTQSQKGKETQIILRVKKVKSLQNISKPLFFAFLDETRVVKHCSSQKSESKSV